MKCKRWWCRDEGEEKREGKCNREMRDERKKQE